MVESKSGNKIIKSLWVGARFVVVHIFAVIIIIFLTFLTTEFESILLSSSYEELLEIIILTPLLVFFTTGLPTFITGFLISLIFDKKSKYLLSLKSTAISALMGMLWLLLIDFNDFNFKIFILLLLYVAVSVVSTYLFIKKEETILLSRK